MENSTSRDLWAIIPSGDRSLIEAPAPLGAAPIGAAQLSSETVMETLGRNSLHSIAVMMGIDEPTRISQRLDANLQTAVKPKLEIFQQLRHPSNSFTVAAILNRPLAANNKTDLWESALHFLSIGWGESNLNQSAVNQGYVVYEGKKVWTATTGALQFTQASYQYALNHGRTLMKSQPYLARLISFVITTLPTASKDVSYKKSNWKQPGYDSDQYLANLGQMDLLWRQVDYDWAYTKEHGWICRHNLSLFPNYSVLTAKYKRQLEKEAQGRQLLMTFLHTNGFGGGSKKKIYHENRLISDTAVFDNLFRGFGVSELIKDSLLLPISEFLFQTKGRTGSGAESGDPQASELEKLNMYKLHNRYTTKTRSNLIKFDPSMAKANGSGVVTSTWSPSRRIPGDRSGRSRPHFGTDLHAKIGTPVYSLVNGVVVDIKRYSGRNFGLTVVIQSISHAVAIRYAHLSSVLVKPGDGVRAGEIVALSGASGANIPHLHVEVLPQLGHGHYGKGVNPSHLGINVSYAVNDYR